jgi:cell division protein FtsB
MTPRPKAVMERADPSASVRLTARAAALMLIVLVMLAFAVAPFRTYLAQRGRLSSLQRQTSTLERQNDALQRRLERLNDPDELERLARACLGMVRPGEIAFLTIPSHGAPHPPAC